MTWQIWRGRQGPTSLTQQLRDAVIDRFKLTENAVDALEMIKKRGRFAGNKVTHIRVFDPSEVIGEITKYSHLEENSDSVRFKGHIDKNGNLFLEAATGQ